MGMIEKYPPSHFSGSYADLFAGVCFVCCGSVAQRGLWPPRPRGFLIIHNDAPQSVGLLLTSDQLVAETST
jgi:hypothetical protein